MRNSSAAQAMCQNESRVDARIMYESTMKSIMKEVLIAIMMVLGNNPHPFLVSRDP